MDNNTLLLSELLKFDNVKSYLNEDQILTLKQVYEDNRNSINNVIKNGFTEDFKNINYTVWLVFVTKIMHVLEKYRTLTGDEKKGVLMETCVIIIKRELPVDNELKILLEAIIRKVFPEIIDSVIDLTKKIHTKLNSCSCYKKLCNFLKSCCKKNTVVEEPAVEPVVEPVAEPAVEPAAEEPVVEPAAEPAAEEPVA